MALGESMATGSELMAKDLLKEAEYAFNKQQPVLSLWQEIAENFYPQRANFLVNRHPGDEWADHLYSSYPVLVQRDLANQMPQMLRRDVWFDLVIKGADPDDPRGRKWLEQVVKTQYNLMTEAGNGFRRTTNTADADFSAFGNAAMTVDWDRKRNGLLYQAWHLKDCAWMEDYRGEIDRVFRKWEPTAMVLAQMFGEEKLHRNIRRSLDTKSGKGGYADAPCRHVMKRGEDLGDEFSDYPWVSCYVDVANTTMIEAVPQNHRSYVIPRWQVVSGTQYAFSPATIVALPEARLLQDIARVLLRAGEKYVDPPMLATSNAVRGDMEFWPGGVTWISEQYDERLGDALRPLTTDKGGWPIGDAIETDRRAILAEAFYTNKLSLPPANEDMTATEVRERIAEWQRAAAPLFEPMESEYNAGLCEATFLLMHQAAQFGSDMDIPAEVLENELDWKFRSPIRDAVDRQDVTRFYEVADLLRTAVELDAGAGASVDVATSLQAAIRGTGAPEDWLPSNEEVERNRALLAQAMQQREAAAA